MAKTIYINNDTFKVDWPIHEEWLAWINDTLLPSIRNSNNVQCTKFVKLLGLDVEDGPTYALQVGFASKADYNRFSEIEIKDLMEPAYQRWGQQFLGFSTLMEVLNDGH